MKPTRAKAGWLLPTLLLGGCATSSVVLLNGEGGKPSGAVAVIDPKTGEDVRVVDRAGSRVIVAGARNSLRSVDTGRAEKRFGRLLSDLPEPPATYILYFPEGSATFSPESIATRDAMLAEVARRGAGVDVQIEGHTDRVGDAADNIVLSRQRAQATLALLVPLGLRDNITRVVGRGETTPVPGHATADGVTDAVNRRVEVIVR